MSARAHEIIPHWLSDSRPSGWATGSLLARWARLLLGLAVFAGGIAFMVKADLGVSSWDVLHDAFRLHTPLTFGGAVIAVSVAVVVISFVLGVKPGPGTIANVLLVGAFTDAILATGFLDPLGAASLAVRVGGLVAGILAIALGTALYIGASLGAGPRDSLMLAAARRLGVTAGTARAFIEGSVLLVGALLGGSVGIGTAVFVIVIGPAINVSFRAFGMETKSTRRVRRTLNSSDSLSSTKG
ncbi:MAG: membrane protein [Actinomycetota bacterium]|nr:membrane protein [Actinomycetota bacterium]